MHALLYIPWFRLEPLMIPTPFGWELPIHPFGVLVATGVLLGAQLARWKAEREGIDPEEVMNLAGWVLVPGFITAHVFDDVFYRPELLAERPWHIFMIFDGISSFGGFFGAIGGGLAWAYRKKVNLLAAGDPIGFGMPLGWLFGRMGCFVVHDHPGAVTSFPLAVADYEVGYPPYQVRHDLGLYEVIWAGSVLLLFLALSRRKWPRGFYVALLPILYAPVRFGLDFLRATDLDHSDARYFGLTPGHYSAIAILLVGIACMYMVWTRPEPAIPQSMRWPPPKSPDKESPSDKAPAAAAASAAPVAASAQDGEAPRPKAARRRKR